MVVGSRTCRCGSCVLKCSSVNQVLLRACCGTDHAPLVCVCVCLLEIHRRDYLVCAYVLACVYICMYVCVSVESSHSLTSPK